MCYNCHGLTTDVNGGTEMSIEQNKSICEITLGRSSIGSICGAGAVVLAILGLVHLLPNILVAVSTIVLGVSLLFKGIAISAEYSKLLCHLSGTTTDKLELGGGMSVEIMTGAAGIVLGILALLGLVPETLISIAIIAFGGGVLLGSGVISRLNSLKFEAAGSAGTTHHKVAHEIVSAAMASQVLAGIAAVVLGILSLLGFAPLTLNLISVLVLGGASLLCGSALTGKMVGLLHTH